MVKKRENTFLHFIAVVVVIIFAGAIIMALGSSNIYKNSTKQLTTKIYKSEVMKLSITIPVGYTPIEKLGSLTLKTNGEIISIGRNGTNFNSLKDYIDNSRNNLQNRISNKRELTINGLEAVVGNIGDEKIYFIYGEYVVYVFSTSSEILFDDLDKIAQSFKYTP